jgi:hypothetical protein
MSKETKKPAYTRQAALRDIARGVKFLEKATAGPARAAKAAKPAARNTTAQATRGKTRSTARRTAAKSNSAQPAAA